MLAILLKSSACLAVFMLFYKLCLEKTSAHTFKRFYLIGILIISIAIPFITFTEYVEVVTPEPQTLDVSSLQNYSTPQNVEIIETRTLDDYLPIILWTIYMLGVILYALRFFKNLRKLFIKIKTNQKLKTKKFIIVLLPDLVTPHTFFNYIFLNKTNYEQNRIPKEVILHEQTHAKQKHALDILSIEVLQILFWFNPLLYFIKKDIKLNHEFLADQAVINNGANTKHYQHLLLAFSSNASHNQMANAINYSLIKKRFTVMKTKTSKTVLCIRSLALLPLLAILIYSFSSTNYETYDSLRNVTIIQKKATKKQVAEYNALAKKYNEQPQNKRIIKLKDVQRLEHLYSLMSESQKSIAQPFPDCPPPPPVTPETPKETKEKLSDIPEPATNKETARTKKPKESLYLYLSEKINQLDEQLKSAKTEKEKVEIIKQKKFLNERLDLISKDLEKK